MSKKLTMGLIKEDNKRYKEFVTLDVDVNGETHEVKCYPYFAPEKVAALREDYFKFKSTAKEENVDISEIVPSDLIGYFILKYFTDVTMTTSKKSKTILNEIKEVLNSKVAEFILNQFPQESIIYVHEKIMEIHEMDEKLVNEIKRVQEEVKNLPLENRDILLGKKKQIPEV